MKQGVLIFIMASGAVFSPFAFSQASDSSAPDPLTAFSNEEKNREENQTPYEMFQDYVNKTLLERLAIQQAFSVISAFLKNIENGKVNLGDVNHMKNKVSEVSTFLDGNSSILSKKEKKLIKSLEQCMITVPEEVLSQLGEFLDEDEDEEVDEEISNRTPVEQFQSYVNDITSGKEAFQMATSIMSDFLESVVDGKVLRSKLNGAKDGISEEESVFSDATDFTLFTKEDIIFEFLELCEKSPSEVTPSQ